MSVGDQGNAAKALAEQTRQRIASAEAARKAAEAAQRQAEELRAAAEAAQNGGDQ